MENKTFKKTIGGKELSVETGRFAYNSNAAVRVQYGETVVLATAVMSKGKREGLSYFPLSVEFDEKFYAAGRIKGSRWVKREGRPTDEAILTSRLIDRTIRPLFDSRLRHDVQIIITNLSFDGENDPDIVAAIASSCALAISDIPWGGPIGAVRVAKVENSFLINPSYEERTKSELELVLAGPAGYSNMIEAGAKEVSSEDMQDAFGKGQEVIDELVAFQQKIAEEVGAQKATELVEAIDEKIKNELESWVGDKLGSLLTNKADMDAVNDLKRDFLDHLSQNFSDVPSAIDQGDYLFEKKIGQIIKTNVLESEKRPDGRALDEIRPLKIEVGGLPRTHGSGIFERGRTQALSILTLGPPGLEQSLETMEFVGKKRFMHHYNFPPFSSGETGRMFTGRREIGHGALAEKAIEPLIPPKEEFPYAIRIVTEILSSNGSTSMAAVCGSSLSLFDAGVPIRTQVAGSSVGVMVEDEEAPEKKYKFLTDIQGPEDHHGNMDFKVAGTKDGITAIQMDVKMVGLNGKMFKEALEEAGRSRNKILEQMNKVIAEPRKDLSPYAPRIVSLKIDPEKIGAVIGPGGKIINSIIEKHSVEIDIEEDGSVFITSEDGKNGAGMKKAQDWIEGLTHEVSAGEIFEGTVTKIMNFGAFVEVLPGQQGLVHISELAPWHVNQVEDIVKIGDRVKVRVKEIDSEGRINLTRKEFVEDKKKQDKSPA